MRPRKIKITPHGATIDGISYIRLDEHNNLLSAYWRLRDKTFHEHGPRCAQRFVGAAECTCGKAEHDAAEEIS